MVTMADLRSIESPLNRLIGFVSNLFARQSTTSHITKNVAPKPTSHGVTAAMVFCTKTTKALSAMMYLLPESKKQSNYTKNHMEVKAQNITTNH